MLNVKRKVTPRRFAEIGRVLEKIGIAYRENATLVPGSSLPEFIACWEDANWEGVNQWLRRYLPYDAFLTLLASDKCIKVPPRNDSAARKRVGQTTYAKANLTFVAVDTFKWWGLAVGQVYISHIGTGHIYWGGEHPTLEQFEAALRFHYRAIRPSDGYANVGQLADRMCQELNIAFIRFEQLLGQLCQARPGQYFTSTSLARRPTRQSPVQTLLPRSIAKQRSESLHPGEPIEWTEKRLIEDGVMLGKHNVKMIRIEEAIS